MLNNDRDVLCVDGALLWMVDVVPANVGVLNGIASGLDINGEGGGIVLESPASAEAHDCFNRYAVEEADEVIVDGGKMDVGWCVVEVWRCCHRLGMESWPGCCGRRCKSMMSNALEVARKSVPARDLK